MQGRVRRVAAAIALTGAAFAGVTSSQLQTAGAVSGPLCSGVTLVAAGQTHAFALRNDGTTTRAYGWGNNSKGQLTISPNTKRTSPVPIDSLTTAAEIAGGSVFTVARFPAGTVKAAGFNSYGQLGDGTTTDSTTLVDTGLTNVTDIDAGGYHVLALKADGTVWAWGRNLEGQLGDGTTTNRATPAQVVGLTGVTAIAAGWHHSLALKSDGTVWAWGLNSTGQLGNGTKKSASLPVQVSGITTAAGIDGGTNFSIARLADQTVRTWGSNSSGQLGIPGGTRTTPGAVSLANVTDVAAGGFHVLATTADGKTWAWGSNANGQLGTGAPRVGPPVDSAAANSSAPVEVAGASGASEIAADGHSSFAIRAAGTLWAWGANSNGQLGIGTIDNAFEPKQSGCPSPAQPTPWSVVLVGEPPTAAPGTPIVLHAIANQDAGDTPYAIQIYDDATKLLVASCATGSSCSAPVTSATAQTRGYTAYVASPSATAPPPFVQASARAVVMWGPTGPGPYSGSCAAGTTVTDTKTDGANVLIQFVRPNPDETWVCFRANNEAAWIGGRVAVVSPTLTPSSVVFDDLAAACTKAGNQAPGPHPLVSGKLDDTTPYVIDTYANGTSAYVCVTVADQTKRVAVDVTGVPPAVIVSLDGV